jgi:hypothetical protein
VFDGLMGMVLGEYEIPRQSHSPVVTLSEPQD